MALNQKTPNIDTEMVHRTLAEGYEDALGNDSKPDDFPEEMFHFKKHPNPTQNNIQALQKLVAELTRTVARLRESRDDYRSKFERVVALTKDLERDTRMRTVNETAFDHNELDSENFEDEDSMDEHEATIAPQTNVNTLKELLLGSKQNKSFLLIHHQATPATRSSQLERYDCSYCWYVAPRPQHLVFHESSTHFLKSEEGEISLPFSRLRKSMCAWIR